MDIISTFIFVHAWVLKRKNKLIPDIVGHVPCEISRFIWFFFMRGGKMEASVLSIRPLPSLMPSGVLEIMRKAKLTIDEKHGQTPKYLQQLIVENYEPNTDIETDETDNELDITDQQLEEEENDIEEVINVKNVLKVT